MAVYKSSHKGSQIDNAVTVANGNKSKGNANLPIYYDANGVAQTISVDTAATANSNKLLTGGGMYNGLTPKLSNSEIQTTVNTSGLPPSQGAAKKYTDTQVATLQDPLISSDTINVGSDGKISVTDGVLRRGTSKLDEKVDHFAEYGIGDDSTVLSEMDEAAHSTFCGVNGSGESDPKKFTKVGSPIVTTDGVASGFSSGNYLTPTNVDLSIANSWTIIAKVIHKISSTIQTVYGSKNTGGSTYEDRIGFSASNNLILSIGADSNTRACVFLGTTVFNTDNQDIWIKAEFTSTAYNLYSSLDGENWTLEGTQNSTVKCLNRQRYIGCSTISGYEYPFTGSIDLKQFSITVDGVEVFSGNKTGIDTIKPDNYTVVGTPTISADGIASGFSSSNYLTKTFSLTPINSVKIKTRLIYSTTGTGSAYPQAKPFLSINNGQNWRLLTDNGNSVKLAGNNITSISTNVGTLNNNDVIDLELLSSGSNTTVSVNINGVTKTPIQVQTAIGNISDATLGYYSPGYYFTGSIDLNAFKIYVDGDLVYQPCLKIPYTLSKDGKKIVNNIYRPRVEDEYTQAGYTPYYTLQRELGDNYTVVGTPIITADGIASGFSNTNYLITNYSMPSGTPEFEISGSFNTGSTIYNNTSSVTFSSSNYNGFLLQTSGNYMRMYTANGGNWGAYIGQASISANTKYYYKVLQDLEHFYFYLGTSKDNLTLISSTTRLATFLTGSNNYPYIGTRGSSTSQYWQGSIDLNAFKIYVDNKLVYTAGRNYTLPTVEENDIISSEEDGINMYTQRANLSLEQTGSCTANTALTFPKPFMNADYALSIPYNSGTKTATGFTPAIDGDYIAEGLGKLY